MATIGELTTLYNELVVKVNSIIANSKSINNLSLQTPLLATSELPLGAGKKTTIQDVIDLAVTGDVIVSKSANYTAIVNDYVLVDATSLSVTITLPTAIGNQGKHINITKTDVTANKVTINTSLSQTINGSLTIVITGQYDNVTLISNGSNWVIN